MKDKASNQIDLNLKNKVRQREDKTSNRKDLILNKREVISIRKVEIRKKISIRGVG